MDCFDEVARYYDHVRPGYPKEMYLDILEYSEINLKSRVLEIGCGTGQSTRYFAEMGYNITCIEPGSHLIKFSKNKFKNKSNLKFIQSKFEDWKPKKAEFDLLYSGTAFHWVNPEVGYTKAASVLRSEGTLALFWNRHPTPYTDFFKDVQEVYRRNVPEWEDPSKKASNEKWVETINQKINETGKFAGVDIKKYKWNKIYSSDDYLLLLDTYSDHHTLEPKKKLKFFTEIKDFIDSNYNGIVNRPYLTILFLSRKK